MVYRAVHSDDQHAPQGDGNSQLSKTDSKACLLYYMVTSIEHTFKHGLNIGWDIYDVLAIRLQVQGINGNPRYKGY